MESFFLFCFYDRKLSSPMRKSCTLPHCLTSGCYGSPVLDVCATSPRWQVVHDPFSLFASRTTLFPRGETAVVNATSQTLFIW